MNGIDVDITEAMQDGSAPVAEWEARPKTATILGLLAGAALILSYLFSYCIINALAASDVIAKQEWPLFEWLAKEWSIEEKGLTRPA